jgi:hypothetical protein
MQVYKQVPSIRGFPIKPKEPTGCSARAKIKVERLVCWRVLSSSPLTPGQDFPQLTAKDPGVSYELKAVYENGTDSYRLAQTRNQHLIDDRASI